MADCRDCDWPVLTNHVVDSDGSVWHLRCLDGIELDYLDPSEIQR